MRIEGWGAAVATQDDRQRESGEGKGCNRVGHFRIEPLGRKIVVCSRTDGSGREQTKQEDDSLYVQLSQLPWRLRVWSKS